MVEISKNTPLPTSTRSYIHSSESGSLTLEIGEVRFGDYSMKQLAEFLGGEFERSWAVGWSLDFNNFGLIKFNFSSVDCSGADCPVLSRVATLEFRPDISAFAKKNTVMVQKSPPTRGFIHMEKVSDAGDRELARTWEFNPSLTAFLAKTSEGTGLFIPLGPGYMGEPAGYDGRVNFFSISPETGIRLNTGHSDESGKRIHGAVRVVPQGVHQLLIEETKRAYDLVNSAKSG